MFRINGKKTCVITFLDENEVPRVTEPTDIELTISDYTTGNRILLADWWFLFLCTSSRCGVQIQHETRVLHAIWYINKVPNEVWNRSGHQRM